MEDPATRRPPTAQHPLLFTKLLIPTSGRYYRITRVLVDSGASTNIVSQTLVDTLRLRATVLDVPQLVNLASGHTTTFSSYVQFFASIGGFTRQVLAIVDPGMDSEFMTIGKPAIKDFGIVSYPIPGPIRADTTTACPDPIGRPGIRFLLEPDLDGLPARIEQMNRRDYRRTRSQVQLLQFDYTTYLDPELALSNYHAAWHGDWRNTFHIRWWRYAINDNKNDNTIPKEIAQALADAGIDHHFEADNVSLADDGSETSSSSEVLDVEDDLWWFYWSFERNQWCFAEGSPKGVEPMHDYCYEPIDFIGEAERERMLAYHESVPRTLT